MKDLFNTMKKEMATMKGEITKLINNGKGKGEGKSLFKISNLIYMGSRVSISNEDDYINDINNINENQLDLSNMDKLQIKAIKQLSKEVKELKDRKVIK